MRHWIPAAMTVALLALPAAAQEGKKVPRDSARISISGCAYNRSFIVQRGPGHEPVRSDIAPGRRFRLQGKKKLLNEIKAQRGSMVEVTGLVRIADLSNRRGVNIGGVRIGGGPPRAPLGGSTARTTEMTGYDEAIIDVESWRPIAATCPAKED
ncbi:MAG TPA: hypothetical protein VF198_10955 [Vicinamibacterales bacterium]